MEAADLVRTYFTQVVRAYEDVDKLPIVFEVDLLGGSQPFLQFNHLKWGIWWRGEDTCRGRSEEKEPDLAMLMFLPSITSFGLKCWNISEQLQE